MKKRSNIYAYLLILIPLLCFHWKNVIVCQQVKELHDHPALVPSLKSYESIEEKNVAIVQFVSNYHIPLFVMNFPKNEEHLFGHVRKAALLLCAPLSDVPKILQDIIIPLEWTHVASYSHIHAYTNGTIEEYVTPKGTQVLVQGMHVHLPEKVLQGHKIEQRCAGRTFQISYAMFSGAVFSHHILQLPIIDRFLYFVKVDADLVFTKDVPFDIGQMMIDQGCSIMHSELEAVWSGCEQGNLEALYSFAASTGAHKPISDNYEWCNQNMKGKNTSFIIYGNFMGYSRSLIQHVRPLASWLYYEWIPGYFGHRWGDQGPSIAYACYALDIPDFMNDKQVCDFRSMREDVFVHG